MEVNVEGVYFGNSSVYFCNTATFSKLSIKMTLSSSADGQTESLVLLKKNIFDLKSSELCPLPVICLKLKDSMCQKTRDLFKLEKKGIKFNSRSKDIKDVWMLIFYSFTTFEVPQFLKTNYIEKKNMLPFQEFQECLNLIASPTKMMLWDVICSVMCVQKNLGAPKPPVCPNTKALIVPQDDRLIAKKFMNYISNVTEGRAVKEKAIEVAVALDAEVFSASDMKQVNENYKNCLVCATCQEDAVLKCKGCKVTRYCSEKCQDVNFSKHKNECSLLELERRKTEVQKGLVLKQLMIQNYLFELPNWEHRIRYEVWEKKFTSMINSKGRESLLKKKDIEIFVDDVNTGIKI